MLKFKVFSINETSIKFEDLLLRSVATQGGVLNVYLLLTHDFENRQFYFRISFCCTEKSKQI